MTNRTFWQSCAIRAAHTACQTALGVIGASVMFQDVNWAAVLSASALAAIVSMLKSIAVGLPEVQE